MSEKAEAIKSPEFNTYYEGKIISFPYKTEDGRDATKGIMDPPDRPGNPYKLSTSREEHVTVLSGRLRVIIPGEPELDDDVELEEIYEAGQSFNIPANTDPVYFEPLDGQKVIYDCIYIDEDDSDNDSGVDTNSVAEQIHKTTE